MNGLIEAEKEDIALLTTLKDKQSAEVNELISIVKSIESIHQQDIEELEVLKSNITSLSMQISVI